MAAGEVQPGGVAEKRKPVTSEHERGFCRRCGAWCGSFGLEPTPKLYLEHTVEIFREVRRVLRKDGTLWLNIGDSYAGSRSGPEGDKVGLEGTRRNQGSGPWCDLLPNRGGELLRRLRR